MTITSEDELTELQRWERKALLGDRGAIILAISGLRRYRQVSIDLLERRRYADGECSSAALARFSCAIEEIETDGHD